MKVRQKMIINKNTIEKRRANIKARYTNANNIKLGNMGVFATLKGDDNYYIPELDMYARGTCGNICRECGCKNLCYVEKAYRRYTDQKTGACSVKLGHAYNTIAIRQDAQKAIDDLNNQLTRKRKKFEIIRINESGEIEDEMTLAIHVRVASLHPETVFYLYTKQYKILVTWLLAGLIPDNMIVLFSVWHEYGIAEYNKVKHLKNVKCYAVIDINKDVEGWSIEDYKNAGLDIDTMCYAYNESGKMDHRITCDKCKKCFDCKKNKKCIGCYAH